MNKELQLLHVNQGFTGPPEHGEPKPTYVADTK